MHSGVSQPIIPLNYDYFWQLGSSDINFLFLATALQNRIDVDRKVQAFFNTDLAHKLEQLIHTLYFMGARYINENRYALAQYQQLSDTEVTLSGSAAHKELAKAIFILTRGLNQLSITTINLISTQLGLIRTAYHNPRGIELKNGSKLPNSAYIVELLHLYTSRNPACFQANASVINYSALCLVSPPGINSFLDLVIPYDQRPVLVAPPSPTRGTIAETPTSPLLPPQTRCMPWCCCFGCRHG